MSTAVLTVVRRLMDADLAGWSGLPALSAADAIAAFGVDPARAPTHSDPRGEPPSPGGWVFVPAGRFERGVRLWLDAGRRIVLVQGIWPRGAGDEPLRSPDLGPADALLDAELGGMVLRGGEHVHAARGLAVRVDPATGDLLEVIAFAPTSPDDYRVRLRPALPVDVPLR